MELSDIQYKINTDKASIDMASQPIMVIKEHGANSLLFDILIEW
jgi:hypothetical protein